MENLQSSKEYVLNHDYGYGQEEEKVELNKLNLRNIEDLKVYVDDAIQNAFVAKYQNNIIEFKDKEKCKIVIERI